MKGIFLYTLTLMFTYSLSLSAAKDNGDFYQCFDRIMSINGISYTQLEEMVEDDGYINLFGSSSCDTISLIWNRIPHLFEYKDNVLDAYTRKDMDFFSNNVDVSNVVDFIKSSFDNVKVFQNQGLLNAGFDQRFMAINVLNWVLKREMQYNSVAAFCNNEREEILSNLLSDILLVCNYNIMDWMDLNSKPIMINNNNNNNNMRSLLDDSSSEGRFEGIKNKIKERLCNMTLDFEFKTHAIELGISGVYYLGFEYTIGWYFEPIDEEGGIRMQKYKTYGVLLATGGVPSGGIMIRNLKFSKHKNGKDLLASFIRTYVVAAAAIPRNGGSWIQFTIIEGFNHLLQFDFDTIAEGTGKYFGLGAFAGIAITGSEKAHGKDISLECNSTNNTFIDPEPVGTINLFGSIYQNSWTCIDNGNWTFDGVLDTKLVCNDDNKNTINSVAFPTVWFNYTVSSAIEYSDDSNDGNIGILFGIFEGKAYYFGIEHQFWIVGIYDSINGYTEIARGQNKQIKAGVTFELTADFISLDNEGGIYNIDFYYLKSADSPINIGKANPIWVADFYYETENGQYANMPSIGSVGVFSNGKKGTFSNYKIEFHAESEDIEV